MLDLLAGFALAPVLGWSSDFAPVLGWSSDFALDLARSASLLV